MKVGGHNAEYSGTHGIWLRYFLSGAILSGGGAVRGACEMRCPPPWSPGVCFPKITYGEGMIRTTVYAHLRPLITRVVVHRDALGAQLQHARGNWCAHRSDRIAVG